MTDPISASPALDVIVLPKKGTADSTTIIFGPTSNEENPISAGSVDNFYYWFFSTKGNDVSHLSLCFSTLGGGQGVQVEY